jgi:hypothetical protein
MLLAVTYKAKENATEESEKRSFNLFTNWTPPQGFVFKAHYVTGSGKGIAIVEADSAIAVLEAMAPWGPHLDFDSEPCVDISESVPVTLKAFAWRDSIT